MKRDVVGGRERGSRREAERKTEREVGRGSVVHRDRERQ